MASIGHAMVGLGAAALCERVLLGERPALRARLGLAAVLIVLALLPDLDVIAFALRIPYAAPFGHRGASHSLVVAIALGLGCGLIATRHKRAFATWAVVCACVVLSHGLLDTLTDGGLGVALFWPIDNARRFAPWRPIPVAPIGAAMLSTRGLHVVLVELALFAPLLAGSLWWRARATGALRP